MRALGPAIFSDELAAAVRREYSALLSIGRSDEEVERQLIEYYDVFANDGGPDEAVFWFALALSEWKKGRLSSLAKKRALDCIENGINLKSWDIPGEQKNYQKRVAVIEELKEKLLSEQPERKKVKKLTIHHCPWKEGDLLAYRAISCPPEKYLYNKYLLLRVVEVQKYPLSRIAPDACYEEMMIIAVYDWIGDCIPNGIDAEKLDFIPTYVNVPLTISKTVVDNLAERLSENLRSAYKELIFGKGAKYCFNLPYKSTKSEKVDITLISQNDGFDRSEYDFLKTDLCSVLIGGTLAFELTQETMFKKFGRIKDN